MNDSLMERCTRCCGISVLKTRCYRCPNRTLHDVRFFFFCKTSTFDLKNAKYFFRSANCPVHLFTCVISENIVT